MAQFRNRAAPRIKFFPESFIRRTPQGSNKRTSIYVNIIFHDKIIGLSDIRNKLIHGDPFPEELDHALTIANIHLEYTLMRVLIKILEWDIEETNIFPAHLENLDMIKDLPNAQLQISNYFDKKNVSN